jgi:hypothetical protein
VFFLVRDEELDLHGDLATHLTVGEQNGFRRERRFCPACGSPALSRLEEMPGVTFLKAGTLDDGDRVRPRVEWICGPQTTKIQDGRSGYTAEPPPRHSQDR